MFTLAIFCYVMNAFMWNIFRHVRIWYEESTVVGWYHRSQLDWDRNTSSRNLLSTKNMTTPQRGTYRQAGVAVWVGTGPNQQENGVEDAWRQKCFLFMKTEKRDNFHPSSISVAFESCACTLCREDCSRPEHTHDQTCLVHWQDRLEDFASIRHVKNDALSWTTNSMLLEMQSDKE